MSQKHTSLLSDGNPHIHFLFLFGFIPGVRIPRFQRRAAPQIESEKAILIPKTLNPLIALVCFGHDW